MVTDVKSSAKTAGPTWCGSPSTQTVRSLAACLRVQASWVPLRLMVSTPTASSTTTSIATLPSRTSILEPSRVTLWRQALVRPSSRSVGTSHIDQNVWRSTPATATSATPSISSSA